MDVAVGRGVAEGVRDGVGLGIMVAVGEDGRVPVGAGIDIEATGANQRAWASPRLKPPTTPTRKNRVSKANGGMLRKMRMV